MVHQFLVDKDITDDLKEVFSCKSLCEIWDCSAFSEISEILQKQVEKTGNEIYKHMYYNMQFDKTEVEKEKLRIMRYIIVELRDGGYPHTSIKDIIKNDEEMKEVLS